MRKIFLPLILLFGVVLQATAQQPKDIMKEPIPVAMFRVGYAFHLPALDNKALYGFSHNVGGGLVYKTANNWLLSADVNFIFGNKLNIDRVEIFGEGITTDVGEIVGGAGSFAMLEVNQRGFHVQGEVGRLFPYGPNPNSGFFVQAGLGYLSNRINVDYMQALLNPPYQVDDDYQYGYDRMRGGPAVHLEAGYLLLNDTRLLNLTLSLEVTYARTRDLRDYDFRVFTNPETGMQEPVGYTDPHKRYNDLYYGIRVTWNIPTYQRQPEEYYYN
ncbi:MAG: hypothetical protein IJ622_05430 [Bacteroidales bacterium]|nr:hypothetical protein [Bacteroidales bacterium]